MTRTLLALSALTCVAGSSLLLAPASAQNSDPICESVVGTPCRQGYLRCVMQDFGETNYLQCFGRTWHWA